MFYNTVRRKNNQWKNSLYCSVTSENNTSTKVAAHILDYQCPKLYNGTNKNNKFYRKIEQRVAAETKTFQSGKIGWWI